MGRSGARHSGEQYREVRVRRDLYEELRRLAEARGLSVPALIEEMFKHYTAPGNVPSTAPSTPAHTTPGRATPSKPVQVTLWPNDPFWLLIRVGEGFYATEVSLNRIQVSRLCTTRLLAEEVCVKAGELLR